MKPAGCWLWIPSGKQYSSAKLGGPRVPVGGSPQAHSGREPFSTHWSLSGWCIDTDQLTQRYNLTPGAFTGRGPKTTHNQYLPKEPPYSSVAHTPRNTSFVLTILPHSSSPLVQSSSLLDSSDIHAQPIPLHTCWAYLCACRIVLLKH